MPSLLDQRGTGQPRPVCAAPEGAPPDPLERVPIAGVEGPDRSWKLPSNIERHVDAIAALVAADSAAHRLLPISRRR